MIRRVPILSRAQWLSLRPGHVGCSEVAALTGDHDFLTAYALAMRKTGRIDEADETPSMRRGKLLEPIAIQLLQEQFPAWRIEQPAACFVDDEARLIGTPDLLVHAPDLGPGVVQIKNPEPSVFRDTWHDDADGPAELSPPIGHAIQVTAEAYLTGSTFAVLAALVVGHGVELHVVDIPVRADVIARIKSELAAFWRLLDAGRMPDPDYGRDADIIRGFYRQDDGTELDLTADNELPEIVRERELHAQLRKTADDAVRAADARILHRIGAATRARFAGGTISAKTVHRASYAVPATHYRQLRFRRDDREAAP
jgi:hypothetical protein